MVAKSHGVCVELHSLGFIIELLGEVFGLISFLLTYFQSERADAVQSTPAELSEASIPGFLQRGSARLSEEAVSSCSFSDVKNGTFSFNGSRGARVWERHDVVVAAMAVPFTARALHLCKAGGSYLNSKHK